MLTSVVTEYSSYLQAEKGMADPTRRTYLAALESLLAVCRAFPRRLHLPDDWGVAQLDKRALEIYLNHLREERGLAPATLALQAAALRSFFDFLQRRGFVERNPARSLLPKLPLRDETPPAGEEAAVRALFADPADGLSGNEPSGAGAGGDGAHGVGRHGAGPHGVGRHGAGPHGVGPHGVGPHGDRLSGARLQLLLELGYGAGLRPAAIYAVRSLRVLPKRGLLRIALPAETLDVPLAPEGLRRAGRYLAQRKEVLGARKRAAFWVDERGRACTPERLARQIKQAMLRVGLPGRPMLLRMLAARHFAERGGDTRSLQRLLHAKRLGSLDRYAPPSYQSVLEQFRRAHPRQGKVKAQS